MSGQSFAITFSTGHLAGSGRRDALSGTVPRMTDATGLTRQQHRVASWLDHICVLGQVQAHARGVADWQNNAAPLPSVGQTVPRMKVDAVRGPAALIALRHAVRSGG